MGGKESLNRQLVLLNIDSIKLLPKLWPKLRGLEPTYLFVDEGAFLKSDPEAEKVKRKMVEAMKHENTLTWVISAMPFGGKNEEAFSERFLSEAPAYDSITQSHTRYQTDERRAKKARGYFEALGDYLFKRRASPGDAELAAHVRRFNFIIRHSPSDIERFLPDMMFLEHWYADDNDRNKKFESILNTKWNNEYKLLIAGMSDGQRAEIRTVLQAGGVEFVDLKQGDVTAAVKKFATEESVQIALMADRAKLGLDSLKAAQTLLFWSDEHNDFTDIEAKTTIIKRVRRLGCTHRQVDIMYFKKEAQGEPRKKRPRLSTQHQE